MNVIQESLTWTLFKKHVSITSAWWRNVARTQRGPKLRANVGRNLGPVDMENLWFFAEGFHFSQLNWLARSFGPPMHEFPCLFFFIGGFVRFGNEIRRAWLIGLSPTFQANYEINTFGYIHLFKKQTIIFHRVFYWESNPWVFRLCSKKHKKTHVFLPWNRRRIRPVLLKGWVSFEVSPQDIFIVWVDPDELGDPPKPQEKLVGKKMRWWRFQTKSPWRNGGRPKPGNQVMKFNRFWTLGGGGFKHFFGIFTPKLGEMMDPIWRAYVSNGLVKNHRKMHYAPED